MLLLASGCSSGFVYNRLDTFASWYFESLVSLNDGQRTELRAWLERTLNWHRQSELTRYATFLSDVATTIAHPGDRTTYESIRQRFEGLVTDLLAKTAPEASELLLRLSPQQVNELLENLAEKTRESTEESATAVATNKWQPKQTKDFTRQLKKWTGSVSPEQRRIIEKHVRQLEPTYSEWAESQQAWRDALRETLTGGVTPKTDVPRRVLVLIEDPNRQWTQAYSLKVERNRERYMELFGELDASLSARQRTHLRAELTKLSQQLTALARG